jgi:threonine/homoserine/homoserine lactone efflux protein
MELIFTVAGIHLIACLSPGPDILLVVLNSLRHGWKTGVATTCGILTGVSIQITLGIAGITYLVSRSPTIHSLTALAGGTWLIYLGARGLLAWRGSPSGEPSVSNLSHVTTAAAWRQGFLVNILNPKALLYFFSLFSVLLGPDLKLGLRLASGVTMIVVQLIAFSMVAIVIDRVQAGDKWNRLQSWLDHFISVILLGLGLWIWITTLIPIVD